MQEFDMLCGEKNAKIGKISSLFQALIRELIPSDVLRINGYLEIWCSELGVCKQIILSEKMQSACPRKPPQKECHAQAYYSIMCCLWKIFFVKIVFNWMLKNSKCMEVQKLVLIQLELTEKSVFVYRIWCDYFCDVSILSSPLTPFFRVIFAPFERWSILFASERIFEVLIISANLSWQGKQLQIRVPEAPGGLRPAAPLRERIARLMSSTSATRSALQIVTYGAPEIRSCMHHHRPHVDCILQRSSWDCGTLSLSLTQYTRTFSVC